MRRATSTAAAPASAGAGPVAPPGEWGRKAGCAQPGLDPVLRGVFSTDSGTPWDADAVRVCRGCPVRVACTAYAATIHPVGGIWGGWRRVDPATARRMGVPAATVTR